MTDPNESLKADLSLSERQRLEAQDQRELRAVLLRRHTEVLDGDNAVEGVHVAMDVRGPAFQAMADKLRD